VIKPPAFTLAEHAMASDPDWEDAADGPGPIEVLARGGSAHGGNPTAAIAALQKLLSIPYEAHSLQTCRSLLRCSGSIRCSIRFGTIRRFKKLVASPTAQESFALTTHEPAQIFCPS